MSIHACHSLWGKFVLGVGLGMAGLVSSAAWGETISVAAAISMKDALAKVAQEYKAETGESVEFTLGSSGQLASQIQSGAPVDLFISAAKKQVDDLGKAGVVDVAGSRVVAGNALVLIVPSDLATTARPESLGALVEQRVAKIAMGETKSVPAGQYAEQALKHAGVFEKVRGKLILGTNVRQVLDYVQRGEVSAGLVYATDAKQAGDQVRVTYTVPTDHHDPIIYPAVLVKASKKQEAATHFMDYLLSSKGQRILVGFGFTSPGVSPPAAIPPTVSPPAATSQPTQSNL